MSYNPFSLINKIILVTGASSGIGKATALECSKLGASVIITGRNKDRLQGTYDLLDTKEGQTHQMVLADLSSEDGIDSLVSNLPLIDGVVSNAGRSMNHTPIKFLKSQDLEDMFQMNTFSHVMLAKNLMKKRLIKKGGSYVITASIGGSLTYANGAAVYGITKSAVNSFMKYAAIELAGRNVRCNSVCPGMIDTPLIHVDTFTEEDLKRDTENYLLKRYGKPEEVALTIAFLLSDASSYITGSSLIVDGGVSVPH